MASKKQTKNPVRIIVLQRGWVVIGQHSQTKDAVVVEKAAVIRRWGTSQGLGELAREGKRPNTVLDECPPVRVHPAAVVMTIDCDQQKWAERA